MPSWPIASPKGYALIPVCDQECCANGHLDDQFPPTPRGCITSDELDMLRHLKKHTNLVERSWRICEENPLCFLYAFVKVDEEKKVVQALLSIDRSSAVIEDGHPDLDALLEAVVAQQEMNMFVTVWKSTYHCGEQTVSNRWADKVRSRGPYFLTSGGASTGRIPIYTFLFSSDRCKQSGFPYYTNRTQRLILFCEVQSRPPRPFWKEKPRQVGSALNGSCARRGFFDIGNRTVVGKSIDVEACIVLDDYRQDSPPVCQWMQTQLSVSARSDGSLDVVFDPPVVIWTTGDVSFEDSTLAVRTIDTKVNVLECGCVRLCKLGWHSSTSCGRNYNSSSFVSNGMSINVYQLCRFRLDAVSCSSFLQRKGTPPRYLKEANALRKMLQKLKEMPLQSHARVIQKTWRLVYCNPEFAVCRRRLLREFVELSCTSL